MAGRAPIRGMMTRQELANEIESGAIETVLTAFPDLYGRLVGKRIVGSFFLDETADHGMHVCDYLLACDMEMDPVPGYAFASWDTGYGDVACVPDFATLRRATWLDKTALILADPQHTETGEPTEIAPRVILKKQLARAKSAGYSVMGASELEFFAFRDSFDAAREKGYTDLETYGGYVEDYHILQGTKIEPLVGDIRRHLDGSGIPVEFSKGEWGAGQQEINLRYCDILEMADRHVIYKTAAKEIAHAHDVSLTFMAKWHHDHAGNSMHVHTSLWDSNDSSKSAFVSGSEPVPGTSIEASPVFRHWLGGQLEHAREIAIFFAPTVNSYKRFVAGTFAPTAIGWSPDNRTAGLRVVGHGSSLRTECRIPGADANPYLAFAALIAAGLDGIAKGIECGEPFRGNLYEAEGLSQVPRTLHEAIAVAEESAWLREAVGDAVLDHYLHFARTEVAKFDAAVTDWERARFFERI